MNLNSIQIIGRVTKQPELKALPTGTNITRIGVATNRTWNQDGVKKEEVEFHSIVAFGKLADIINQYVEKGQLIYIQGRVKTSSWEKDGAKHYKTEIIAENMQMGPKSNNLPKKEEGEEKESVEEEKEVNPEDIPF
jgi:single-strand DNA-binding protein